MDGLMGGWICGWVGGWMDFIGEHKEISEEKAGGYFCGWCCWGVC